MSFISEQKIIGKCLVKLLFQISKYLLIKPVLNLQRMFTLLNKKYLHLEFQCRGSWTKGLCARGIRHCLVIQRKRGQYLLDSCIQTA